MRIEVRRDSCEGHGLCEEAAPALYALDAEGYVVFKHADRDVPAADQASAVAGAKVCPVAALRARENL